jgi:hypothetical protein
VPVTTDQPRPSTTVAPATTTSAGPTTTVFAFGFDQALISKVWVDYEAAIKAIQAVVADPDPRAPLLEQHLTGEFLSAWRGTVAEMASSNQRGYFAPDTRHRSALVGIGSVTPTSVELIVCSFDDQVVADRTTGSVVDDDKTTLRSIDTMLRVGGDWKLSGRNAVSGRDASCDGLF